MASVLVVGASRGIGLEFARAYAADGWEVHATVRAPAGPDGPGAVPGDVTLHDLDVRDAGRIAALAAAFEGRALDLLIHNAGVLQGAGREEMMAVNADAPIAVAGALAPAVARARGGKVAILTSRMGSRDGGGMPSGLYGESKCRLNDRFREIEPEWRAAGLTAVVFHPGWVATEMGGPGAPVGVSESVAGMRRVIAALASGDSGRFLDYRGEEVPW